MAKKPPLILVPGLKNCKLMDTRTGKTKWVHAKHVIGLESSDIRLPMRLENETQQARDKLTPQSLVDHVGMADFFGKFLEYARTRDFHSYLYDWRRDILETASDFVDFVRKVHKQTKQKVQIVAFSMGGIITYLSMPEISGIVQSVLFVGVPFGTGVGYLKDMHKGCRVGLNASLLTPEVLFTFPSNYLWVPRDKSGLVDERGRPISMDWHSADAWIKHRMSVFQHAKNRKDPRLKAFLQWCLDRSLLVRQLMSSIKLDKPPRFGIMATIHLPTPDEVMKTKDGFEFHDVKHVMGDGRIPTDYRIKIPYPYKFYLSTKSHGEMMTDMSVLKRAIEELIA